MKAKTIKSVIKNKLENWFDSIEDDDVRKLAKSNTIVTGGCIASMLLREKPNDFDVYFRTHEAARAVTQYYLDRFAQKEKHGVPVSMYIDEQDTSRVRVIIKSAGIASEDGTDKPYQYFETVEDRDAAGEYANGMMDSADMDGLEQDIHKELREEMAEGIKKIETENPFSLTDNKQPGQYRPVFISENAITLTNKVQLVLRFLGEPEVIHEFYDFVHCTNYYTSWDNQLVLKKDALESLITKELRYVGSKFPVCSVIRLRKFIARGWTINAGQILKMCMQLNELDLNNLTVLRDQLTGVDVHYFMQVLRELKDKDPNGDRVNSTYLIEVIDRMF